MPITANYGVSYGDQCSVAEYSVVASGGGDRCKERARRLDGLQLYRVPLPSEARKDDPACTAACKARLANADEVAECARRCEEFDDAHKKN